MRPAREVRTESADEPPAMRTKADSEPQGWTPLHAIPGTDCDRFDQGPPSSALLTEPLQVSRRTAIRPAVTLACRRGDSSTEAQDSLPAGAQKKTLRCSASHS